MKELYVVEDAEECQANYDFLEDALKEAEIGNKIYRCEPIYLGTVEKTLKKSKETKVLEKKK